MSLKATPHGLEVDIKMSLLRSSEDDVRGDGSAVGAAEATVTGASKDKASGPRGDDTASPVLSDTSHDAESVLGKNVLDALNPQEAIAVMEALEEYPYEVTEEATESFRGHLTTRLDVLNEIPVLTESQASLNLLPENLGRYHARESRWSSSFSRVGKPKNPPLAKLSAMQAYAIWDWGAREEQILPVEAFLRFISVSHYAQPIAQHGKIWVTPLSVAFASLAPGSQNSEFIAKAWSITRVMKEQLTGGEWEDDEAVLNRFERAFTGICFHELQRTLDDRGVKYDGFYTFTKNPKSFEMERWGPLRDTFTVAEVKNRWLDESGAAYIHALVGGRSGTYDQKTLDFILDHYSGEVSWRSIFSGGRLLLDLYPSFDDEKDDSLSALPSKLLPLDFLLSIPTLDVSVIGELQAMVEEYNVEWALAAFDWGREQHG